MKRKVIKVGGSLMVIIGSLDAKLKNIEEGDIIDFEIKEVIKKNEKIVFWIIKG